MTNNDNIEGILSSIGLSKAEISILKTLLINKSMRATDIARKSGLNRTTTYGTLNSLVSKGLATSLDDGKVLVFQSIEPHLLVNYIERHRATLLQSEDLLKRLLPEIENKRMKKQVFPKIQYFKGIDGMKQAYEDILNMEGRELEAFTGADAIYEIMGEEWTHYFIHKRKDLGIKARVIAPDTKVARIAKNRDKNELRTTMLIPDKFSFGTEIDIYDKKVGIFSFSKENPVAVIIEDELISNTLKNIFEHAWEKEGDKNKKI